MANKKSIENVKIYIIRKNNVNKINLEVNEHNINAIKLYRKFGFRDIGTRRKYYEGKEDAIVMTYIIK